MVFKVIRELYLSQYFPLNFSVRNMQPNILLMCKLMFATLCVHGFVGYIEDPHIPFIPFFDVFLNYPNVFKFTFKSLFVCSGIFLLFNFKPRTMSLILGATLIIILLSSKPLFRNHLFICGCAFLLAGLLNKNDFPWLLFIQLSLVYFGAVINKIFQIDWWNGEFMHNWLVNARDNQIFIYASDLLPDMLLAKLLSWFSMLIEFCIAVSLLFKSKHYLVVWIILLFHTSLYTLTAFRFGHFYEDIVIFLLIFINWPSREIKISFNKSRKPYVLKIMNILNFSRTFNFKEKTMPSQKWVETKIEDKIVSNWHALKLFLIYSTNFYIFLFFLDLLVRYLFNYFLMDVIHISLTWLVILFFIPLLLYKKNKKSALGV